MHLPDGREEEKASYMRYYTVALSDFTVRTYKASALERRLALRRISRLQAADIRELIRDADTSSQIARLVHICRSASGLKRRDVYQ